MPETVIRPPTAATMRLDGGHPALELVNTIYGQLGGPVEADVLADPEDLVTLARRLGLAGPRTPAGAGGLEEVRALRPNVDALLRARVGGEPPPADALRSLEGAARAALAAARLESVDGVVTWTWPDDDARSPVHRLAHAALQLLGDEVELARLHQCAGCRSPPPPPPPRRAAAARRGGRARAAPPVRRLLLAVPRSLARRGPSLVLDGGLRHRGQEAPLCRAPP